MPALSQAEGNNLPDGDSKNSASAFGSQVDMPLPNHTNLISGAAALVVPGVLAFVLSLPQGGEVRSVIVQGDDLAALKTAVQSVGGEITHELGIINAVGADLTSDQLAALQRNGNIKQTFADGIVETAGGVVASLPNGLSYTLRVIVNARHFLRQTRAKG